MDKSILNQFTSYVEQLRNTECSQKEKITYFQHIAECIMSSALAGHINYATHINTATTVLLLFCEDLDPVVRMNAEENLNRIFRALEKTRVSRILMDLYGEIKRNGNQRSLRICLNLFAYYAPQIRERNIKWYAVRLLPCLQTIAQRKETQLCETLCEFVRNFGKYLQMGLTDSESCKLFEAFMANIGVECAVKRRCSAQNCISLIENSRNKSLMAKHGLSKAFEFLLADQQQHNVVGVLGFLRLLLPLIIHGFSTDCPDDCDDGHSTQAHAAALNKGKAANTARPTKIGGFGGGTAGGTPATTTAMPINTECRQIIEIFDYCLHLLNISSASQHAIINAALEVINAVLQALDSAAVGNNNNNINSSSRGNGSSNNNDILKCLQAALCNQQLQHAEYLRRRKSLKNQIFQLRNYEAAAATSVGQQSSTTVPTPPWQQQQRQRSSGVAGNFNFELTGKDVDNDDEVVLRRAPNMRFTGRSVSECVIDEDDDETHRTALSTDLVAVAHTDVDADDAIGGAVYTDGVVGVLVDVDDDDFTTLSEINEPQQLRASTAVAMVPPSYALTTTIDVDNLIDAIDATTTTTTTATASNPSCSSGNRNRTNIDAVQTKIQGMQPQNEHQQQQQQQQQHHSNEQQSLERQVEPQNLLTAPSQIGAVSFGGGVGGVGGDAGGSGSGDDKSQHLSDIDNESFNSIDFEAEITIAGMTGATGTSADGSPTKSNAELITTTSSISGDTAAAAAAPAAANDNAVGNKLSSSTDTIGSFFNNLISNAASESMSKLFRPSSAVRATPTKSAPPTASDKFDVASTASAAPSTAPADSISLISVASSGNKALDSGNSAAADPQSDSVHTYTHSIASSSLGMHDDTVSTALLVDTSLQSATEYDTERTAAQTDTMGRERRVPNANPFLNDKTLVEQSASGLSSLLTLKIGTPFEQSLVRYTARLIAARFLLTGQASVLLNDTQIRISIKSLSLSVLAHCVRFDPEVLQLPLEISARELLAVSKRSPVLGATATIPSSSKSSSASASPQSDDNVSGSSSNLGKDYEHLDAVDFIKSGGAQATLTTAAVLNDLPAELQLLEIKDDHFGKSTCDYFLHSTTELSKSADPVLMSQQMRVGSSKPAAQLAQQSLSKSEIIASKKSQKQQPQRASNQSHSSPYRVTESAEDAPPQMLPPRPPKRTKSQRKSIAAATATVTALMQIDEHISRRPAPDAPTQQHQQLTDVLLYYNHSDPMLRGGVQQIIGGFLQAMDVKDLRVSLKLNVQHLLAMLVKGLQDDIHTVVIQALNAFEKIFPYVVSKYLMLPAAHHQQKQQNRLQQQQQQTHADSTPSTVKAASAAEAVDKSGRKCHANAAGQVPQQQQQQQQQQYTNDATKCSFRTHVSCKSPATTTKTCPRTLFNDNDALIAALLNDFQLQSKSNRNGNDNTNNTNDQNVVHTNDTGTQPQTSALAAGNTTDAHALPHPHPLAAAFRISPKLLLSKLRLCHYNKYWLVQNKYAEVISNLNYAALHAACNDCHGYCCGTAIGCACDIDGGGGGGGAEVLQDAATDPVSCQCCDVFVTDNNTVNATLPGGDGANATKDAAYACGADMSYKDLDDSVCIYESQFLDELLQLIGNDDFRVRENAALCLCRFIIQNAKRKQQQQQELQQQNDSEIFTSSNKSGNSGVAPFGFAASAAAAAIGDDKSLSPATYETNFNLLWDFFDYRLFSGLPLALRNLFRATSSPALPSTTTATEVTTAASSLDVNGDFSIALPQRHRAEEERLLAKVLYRMTNKLMELEDKNAQFGIIYTLKMLLQDFNFIDYQRAWMEFNFIEICQRFSYYNYATAVDLACQNDLIDVTGKLMAGYMLASTLTADQPERALQLQLDQLLVHVMKILNIYYHLITQQKPQLFVKVQKSDLFANAKELALVQSVGYFGSDYIYIKLYNILRSANDSYKITINQESGRLLISLLRTCLNTLGLCIELRAHTAPTPAGTPTGHTPSHGRQRGHSPGSSGADTAFNAGPGGSGGGGGGVFPTNATLKLIEEILQYLSKLVNYAPGECIACLRQLLKYLFGQNYGNQQRDYYATFIRPYFVVRSKGQQLQLHLQQQQQQSPQKQQKWPTTYNKQQQQQPQQGSSGSSRRGSNSSSGSKFTQASGDQQQTMSMLHAINSGVATTLASTAAAGGLPRSMATASDGSTSALRGGAAGDGLSTPTMTTSTVRHNEPHIIGAQATYANRGQALIDSVGGSHASGGVRAAVAVGDYHNQPYLSATEYYRLMGELFASGLNLQAAKSERAGDCVKHIKLFEPLVIYCLMLFLKSNARVQAPILELLSQLLELNVTYSVLDSKNVIFDQILNNLDLIENGIVRNGPVIIPPMIKFLIQLTHKSDRKLITIPKIISITNNLLANNAVLDCAVLALKSLSYEIFFMPLVGGNAALNTLADYRAPFQSPVTRSPVQQRRHAAEESAAAAAAAEALLANSRELDTQKEVVLGMLEKFVDANELQHVVALLLLRERCAQQMDGGAFARRMDGGDASSVERQKSSCILESTRLQDPGVVYALICRAMCDGRLGVQNWRDFYTLESCFKNYSKYVLADSKNFLALLQLFLTEGVESFSALSHATIILANVILKTEEIYLVNHIKLYLKNHPAVEERERERANNQRKQQQQQQKRAALWLLDGPSTSSAAARAAATVAADAGAASSGGGGGGISEINYFAKVLCEKLEHCFDAVSGAGTGTDSTMPPCGDLPYCQLMCRFVAVLHEVCCRSRHKDALQSVFRLVLAESALLDKYCNFLTMDQWQQQQQKTSTDAEVDADAGNVTALDCGTAVPVGQALQLQLEVLKLLSAMKLLDPVVMLQLLKQQKQNALQQLQQQKQQQQQQLQQMATNKERLKWYDNMQRTLLSEICQQNPYARDWSTQQVRQLLELGDATFLNFLITENFELISDLCEVAAAQTATQATREDALDALWLRALLQYANALNKHSIRALPPLLLRLCNATRTSVTGCNLQMALLSLQVVQRLHTRNNNARALQVRLERLARRLVFNCSAAPLQRQQLLQQLTELAGDSLTALGSNSSSATFWQQLLLDTQECKLAAQPLAALKQEQQQQQELQLQQRIIDEKWLLSQLIKFSAQSDYGAQQLSRILLEIQSEQKLYKIFSSVEFAVARVLRHAIASSMQAMLAAFRNNCIQHNPHIHYMQPNPLVRVTLAVLMTRISEEIAAAGNRRDLHIPIMATPSAGFTAEAVPTSGDTEGRVVSADGFYLCDSVATLLEQVKKVEDTALLYIESRFIDKFVREQLLRHEHVATLLGFLDWCCWQAQQLLQQQQEQQCQQQQQYTLALLQCIAALLQQRFIWTELNQMEKPSAASIITTTAMAEGNAATAAQNPSTTAGSLLSPQQRNLLLCRVLDVLVLAARQSLQHTIFYKHYRQQAIVVDGSASADGDTPIDSEQQNIFNALSAAAAATALECALQTKDNASEDSDVAIGRLLQAYAPQAVFIAKLIEMRAEETTSGAAHLSAAYLTGGSGKGVFSLGSVGGALSGGGGSGMTSGAAGAVGGAAASGVRAEFDNGSNAGGIQIPMHILSMIGTAVMRTNQFYAYAVTPFEIIQQQQRELRIEQLSPAKRAGQTSQTTASAATTAAASSGKLPTIPVESLSDVDVLRKFVKRLSIFGFTTRQQFEEYFMTFLLLINKVYDENMVDEQEQFQIRSTCLEAILELLITYKTFPIVGNKLSHFHHTTRWTRINCDSISLKKLHKVQLLVSEANIFYHPNLERELRADCDAHANYNSFACRLRDTVIGTNQFRVNQYDLNFMWQQMEAYAQYTANSSAPDAQPQSGGSGGGGDIGATIERRSKRGPGAPRDNEDVATKNYRYFTAQSGVDFKSSTQLIFDVLMQIIEHNHILVLPNLVKFTEICESRDQIKWIKEKALKLQETIPMDDTISHQHLIYLLCKTQAMLIPTLGELQQLCQLIGNYLKSSHIFIRNATLAGLLCLLECCSKTNTTIGRLSDELALLRELIVGYINRHGIIDVSAMQCSDTHTKLVWTLNYCLIEWTSKFVPQCHLLSNTVIAAGNFLRKTNNEDVYLCVLHGLERMVVISNTGNGGMSTSGSSGISNPIGSLGVGIVTPMLRNKIEKLALDLVKLENERFSIPALQLLLSCMYMGSAKQLENTELSNGIVQDEPEIIAQQTDKVDILLHCIKSATRDAAWIYGQVLCQIIRDLVPPNEILTKVIKEFLAINQPHCDVIAMIVYQVFRCAIDSTFLQVLQDWLICSLPTFLALPAQKAVWCLSVIFLSASINLHLIKLFPVLLSTGAAAAATEATTTSGAGGIGVAAGAGGGSVDATTAAGLTLTAGAGAGAGADVVVGEFHKLGQHEIALFVTAAVDFHAKLSAEQRLRFRDAFEKFAHRQPVYAQLLLSL
ncbi:uncharacterized protein LOC105217216 isoform X1 [Zeugodacus cucurbitae]|uniref:uncharacterized protein LOC105217216 isoform X1 n=1 Tax=Zeugodacus cucurbitae TaxID=28588 RepID=UPI0023D90164|nr:uncharacterized protein LOC105217216 isoform X1 [Zeugodacus cucurbitae]